MLTVSAWGVIPTSPHGVAQGYLQFYTCAHNHEAEKTQWPKEKQENRIYVTYVPPNIMRTPISEVYIKEQRLFFTSAVQKLLNSL
jgi:hypothetical protein